MRNLKQSFSQPLKAVPVSLVIFLLIIALIGFADATYLTVEHFLGIIPPCSITAGCDKVLTSTYAVILGIPTALMGSIYYFLILVGLFAYLDLKKEWLLRWTLLFTAVGFLFSLWFVFLQIFVIGSYCAYCLGSAITSTILFITALFAFKKFRPNELAPLP